MKIRQINKFNLSINTLDESFFGLSNGRIDKRWDNFRNKVVQLDLFKRTNNNVKINITDFWMSAMCPKMFEAYFLTKELNRPPHHPPILEIGTIVDKIVKDYMKALVDTSDVDFIKEQYYQSLERRLRNLSTHTLQEHEIEEYLDAFVDFMQAFKEYKLVEKEPTKVKIETSKMSFSGDFDLLLEHKESKEKVLIDLKLRKFGSKVEELKIYEILQVILYGIALKEREVNVISIGYYYFHERTFITDSEILKEDLKGFIDNLAKKLLYTREFKPKECFLCFICKLKNTCSIGKTLLPEKTYKPLLFKQMNQD